MFECIIGITIILLLLLISIILRSINTHLQKICFILSTFFLGGD